MKNTSATSYNDVTMDKQHQTVISSSNDKLYQQGETVREKEVNENFCRYMDSINVSLSSDNDYTLPPRHTRVRPVRMCRQRRWKPTKTQRQHQPLQELGFNEQTGKQGKTMAALSDASFYQNRHKFYPFELTVPPHFHFLKASTPKGTPLMELVDDSLYEVYYGNKSVSDHIKLLTCHPRFQGIHEEEGNNNIEPWMERNHPKAGNILHACVMSNDVDMARQILHHMSNTRVLMEAMDGDGMTPHDLASICKNMVMCQLLEDHGSKPNIGLLYLDDLEEDLCDERVEKERVEDEEESREQSEHHHHHSRTMSNDDRDDQPHAFNDITEDDMNDCMEIDHMLSWNPNDVNEVLFEKIEEEQSISLNHFSYDMEEEVQLVIPSGEDTESEIEDDGDIDVNVNFTEEY